MQGTPQTVPNPAAPTACPVCGQELPPQVPPSRCPRCLLRQGLPTDLDDTADATVAAPASTSDRALPRPGETFGHYRIGRPLGEGGMGAVFEAEDLDSGRRLALKVLGHRLDTPDARTRFFREGRLAASVNHPNSVYVFGTEEIAGVPVIAMELVAGGTLQDRVSRHGPMSVGEVVDSVLQIMSGLEAAQRVGVLHRDVKPSNCFVESDGTVKIGDFGLSISTFVRTEPALTAAGAFLGTPAFSSPEQLRGDELTVRSDIYAVGVTLYYLLTAHHPFEAPDLVRMLATVLERRAESPAKWVPGLPAPLCRIVLRCLEKDPEKRFRSYPELRDALLPFASTAPTPATLRLRVLAYYLDALVLVLPSTIMLMLVRGAGESAPLTLSQLLLYQSYAAVLTLGYYGLMEGAWGASVGKFIVGLRVARLDRTVPGVARALLRTLIQCTIPHSVCLVAQTLAGMGSPSYSESVVSWIGFLLLGPSLQALLFATARKRNGYAAMHDLASATRVIVKSAYQARPLLAPTDESLPQPEGEPRIGPYHVLDRLGGDGDAELLLGFDARLLRRVWIRKLPVGAAPLSPELRCLSRPGRLRWQAARRSDSEAWDAYEAAPGEPLLTLIARPQAWGQVRFWLLDLALELDAAIRDGSMPAGLGLDRVWITADGRAKLLDFPGPGTAAWPPGKPFGGAPAGRAGGPSPAAPGAPGTARPTGFMVPGHGCAAKGPSDEPGSPVPEVQPPDSRPCTPQTFLRQIALSALAGRPLSLDEAEAARATLPLAQHAVQFLETLEPDAELKDRIVELRLLLGQTAEVTRARRAALVAAALALPLLTVLVGLGDYRSYDQAVDRARVVAADLVALRSYVTQHQELEQRVGSGDSDSRADLEALATYIAGRFAPLITNAAVASTGSPPKPPEDSARAAALRIFTQQQTVSPEQFAAASARVEASFKAPPRPVRREPSKVMILLMGLSLTAYLLAVKFVILPCLIGSLLFRGGALVKLLGVVFVTRTGGLASRWRVSARNLLAWLPFLLLLPGVRLLMPTLGLSTALLLLPGIAAALAIISVLLPRRGLADRLTGTWLVPK